MLWRVLFWIGIGLLPAPVLGWGASSWIIHRQIETLVLPTPWEAEDPASPKAPPSWIDSLRPKTVTITGQILGLAGLGLFVLAWTQQHRQRAARDSGGDAPWR